MYLVSVLGSKPALTIQPGGALTGEEESCCESVSNSDILSPATLSSDFYTQECFSLRSQGSFFHQGDQRGPAVSSEQSPGLHPEQDSLLPHEYPRLSPHHLPLPARGERVQPPGEDWGRLWPLGAGQTGEQLALRLGFPGLELEGVVKVFSVMSLLLPKPHGGLGFRRSSKG